MGEREFREYTKARRRRLVDTGEFSRSALRQVELAGAVVHQLARANRVIIATNYLAIEDGDVAGEDANILVMAGLVVSTLLRSDLQTSIPLTADVLAKTFGESVQETDQPVRFDNIEPPTICDVSGTEAVRLLRLMTISGEPGEEFKQFTQTYLVPVAKGDAVIVMQFSTINLDYARQFSELFEQIASTLRVLYPDDPTFLDEDGNDAIESITS